MRKLFLYLSMFSLCFMVVTSGSQALNITINDDRSGPGQWYTGIGQGNENQEVEPGMQANQNWDLEAFLLEGSTLSMEGGFNFLNGYGGVTSGDIFVDTNGDAAYGTSATIADLPKFNNYDYVFDIDWSAKTYAVYKLVIGGSNVHDVYNYNSPESSPWSFEHTGELQLGVVGSFTASDRIDGEGTHYKVDGFNMAPILADLGVSEMEFVVHFTMGCGNDNLMGKGTAVPEPATVTLLGLGLVGLAAFGRRKFIK